MVNFLGYGGFGVDGSSGAINATSTNGQAINLIGYDWGVWSSMIGGTYSGTETDNWYLPLNNELPQVHRWAEVIGDKFSNNEISGDVAGAWVSVSDATTGVMGGDLAGTFDPLTWQAVAVGTYIDTPTYLNMVVTDQAALEALNIPYIEIGTTDLSYSSGGTNLTDLEMNDVKFFAYSDGARPLIWATGDVRGVTTDGASPALESVTLTGAGFDNSVTFTVNNYDNVTDFKWDASVDGSGTVGGHDIDIEGGAAGSVDLVGSTGVLDDDPLIDNPNFSGTGAGVATEQEVIPE
jgi:hypothetical protein